MNETTRTFQRIIYFEFKSLKSIEHEKIHVENVKNVVEKTYYRRESFKKINRRFKLVDRKLRRTNLENKKNNMIHAILSVLIENRIRKMLNEKTKILNVTIIVSNE